MRSIIFCFLSLVRVSLQWADCGEGQHDTLIKFLNVGISSVNGNVTANFDGQLKTGLTGPPKVNVTVEKNQFGPWAPVRCINHIGSCMYDSPCDFVKKFFNQASCPTVYRGKGCSGLSLYHPIPFYFDAMSFNLANAADGVKSFLTGSALRVQVNLLQEKKGTTVSVGCLSFFISLDLPCVGEMCAFGK